VRRLYGLDWTREHAVARDVAVRAMRSARLVAPRRVTRGWNTASFDLVQDTEAWRIAHGKWTPQVLTP
jgi:hypothetical protein